MCRKLTVTCQRKVANIEISDHYYTFQDLRIPCKDRGSFDCRVDAAELADFQNTPTTCAGEAAGLHPESPQCEAHCHEALKKYGQALYRMNTKGPGNKWSLGKWLRSGPDAVEEHEVTVRLRKPEEFDSFCSVGSTGSSLQSR